MTHFITTCDDPTSVEELKSRWMTDEFHKLQLKIIDAIVENRDLPDETPTVAVTFFGNKKHHLCDLRGIDLSGLDFWSVDLAYCCFDYANLSSCVMISTSLQYSTFKHANLEGITWKGVQGSPIDAEFANFKGAFIEDSFMMMSNLDGADFTGATLTNAAMDGSSKKNAPK